MFGKKKRLFYEFFKVTAGKFSLLVHMLTDIVQMKLEQSSAKSLLVPPNPVGVRMQLFQDLSAFKSWLN